MDFGDFASVIRYSQPGVQNAMMQMRQSGQRAEAKRLINIERTSQKQIVAMGMENFKNLSDRFSQAALTGDLAMQVKVQGEMLGQFMPQDGDNSEIIRRKKLMSASTPEIQKHAQSVARVLNMPSIPITDLEHGAKMANFDTAETVATTQERRLISPISAMHEAKAGNKKYAEYLVKFTSKGHKNEVAQWLGYHFADNELMTKEEYNLYSNIAGAKALDAAMAEIDPEGYAIQQTKKELALERYNGGKAYAKENNIPLGAGLVMYDKNLQQLALGGSVESLTQCYINKLPLQVQGNPTYIALAGAMARNRMGMEEDLDDVWLNSLDDEQKETVALRKELMDVQVQDFDGEKVYSAYMEQEVDSALNEARRVAGAATLVGQKARANKKVKQLEHFNRGLKAAQRFRPPMREDYQNNLFGSYFHTVASINKFSDDMWGGYGRLAAHRIIGKVLNGDENFVEGFQIGRVLEESAKRGESTEEYQRIMGQPQIKAITDKYGVDPMAASDASLIKAKAKQKSKITKLKSQLNGRDELPSMTLPFAETTRY